MLFKIFFVCAAYLIGSINTAILVGKATGIGDVRKKGSGNAGSTNMLRVGGKKAALMTLCGDILKGVIVVVLAKIYKEQLGDIAFYLACLAVIVGHDFPVFFGFRGGKGVATSAAVMIVLDFPVGICITVLALLIMIASRYVSLGSVLGAVLYPVSVSIFRGNAEYIVFAVLVAILAVERHKSNIKRLINGTENKLFKKD